MTPPRRIDTTELAAAALPDRPTAPEARLELFERLATRLHAYFHRLVGPDAEECAQETLLELQRSLLELRYQPGRSMNAWAFLKAHRVYVAWCRRRERTGRELPARLAPRGPEDPRVAAERRLDAAYVLGEVAARLGAETCECFVLRHEGGLGLAELAEVSGCDRRTVSRRLQRAHALIAELLEEGGAGGA